MGLQLNSNEIAKILPHRFPFALVDRIVDGEPGQWAKGIKCVSVGEPVFCGHFPQEHVMPGVLIIEAMAQACAIIALSRLPEGTDRKNSLFYFAGIDKARFKQVVQPGDQLMIEGKFIRSKLGLGIFEAVARVDGKVVAQAEMMCAYRPVAPKTSDAGKQA